MNKLLFALISLLSLPCALVFADSHDDVAVLNEKGVELAQAGNYEEAILYFENALEINPDHRIAWANLVNAEKPTYKDVDGFMEIIVRNSDGYLISYMRPTIFKVLDHPLLQSELDKWKVDQVITRNGQEFQVLKRESKTIVEEEDPFKTVGKYGTTVVTDKILWIYVSNSHQIPLKKGDEMTAIFTTFRPVE